MVTCSSDTCCWHTTHTFLAPCKGKRVWLYWVPFGSLTNVECHPPHMLLGLLLYSIRTCNPSFAFNNALALLLLLLLLLLRALVPATKDALVCIIHVIFFAFFKINASRHEKVGASECTVYDDVSQTNKYDIIRVVVVEVLCALAPPLSSHPLCVSTPFVCESSLPLGCCQLCLRQSGCSCSC